MIAAGVAGTAGAATGATGIVVGGVAKVGEFLTSYYVLRCKVCGGDAGTKGCTEVSPANGHVFDGNTQLKGWWSVVGTVPQPPR